jgi:hypothetical protein
MRAVRWGALFRTARRLGEGMALVFRKHLRLLQSSQRPLTSHEVSVPLIWTCTDFVDSIIVVKSAQTRLGCNSPRLNVTSYDCTKLQCIQKWSILLPLWI